MAKRQFWTPLERSVLVLTVAEMLKNRGDGTMLKNRGDGTPTDKSTPAAADSSPEPDPALLGRKLALRELRGHCETCVWWDVQLNTDGEQGACHRHAPAPAWVDAGDRDRENRWPTTFAWDFCSEHQLPM